MQKGAPFLQDGGGEFANNFDYSLSLFIRGVFGYGSRKKNANSIQRGTHVL